MSTLTPRPPYTKEEIHKLYPEGLELQLVQVLLRHGERVPVSARFQNAGLPPYWPYCHAAQSMRSVVMSPTDISKWNSLQWRRRLEKFGGDDGPVIASGARGEVDGICQLGELTDTGRETTYSLGTRLRTLYVDQLKYMPALISNADLIYLRATPMPRALESVQQTFWGMYPLTARTASFPPPTIITRTFADETLFPNEGNCRRFAQLSRAFAQRAADRWNDSDDMNYITSMITQYMPESSKKVAVDSHPRLSGIMDTINSTLAHGPETRLPKEFYDEKLRKTVEKIGVEEWFAGYQENREYRTLGIGSLMGDIVERMTAKVEGTGLSIKEVGGEDGSLGKGRGGETGIKFAMSGCHDTTLAAILSSLGCFNSQRWPPYTSHIALELFKDNYHRPRKDLEDDVDDSVLLAPLLNKRQPLITRGPPPPAPAPIPRSTSTKKSSAPEEVDDSVLLAPTLNKSSEPGWFASLLGFSMPSSVSIPSLSSSTAEETIDRTAHHKLSSTQAKKLDPYYVRIRYNDEIVTIPACKQEGNHLPGDESFCTLEAFKRVVDSFTPENWKVDCGKNLEGPASTEVAGLGGKPQEPAGHVEEGY